MATLTIWNTDPLVDCVYECSALLLAAWMLLDNSAPLRWEFALPLGGIALWGFCQLALGATVDRSATWSAALRFAGFAGTALAAQRTLRSHVILTRFLHATAWFGFLVSIVAVLAYYTSPGRVLWIFDAPYPDVWGPFLSRNNFAQFLELVLPIALWLSTTQRSPLLFGSMAAVILAAGFASASRAGAALLALEAVAFFMASRVKGWRRPMLFAGAVLALAVIAGAQTLVERFSKGSPLAYRDKIYFSTLDLIASRPLQGYGLGTYAWVYPRFAEVDFGYWIEHAHNDWLEWTAEGGLGFTAMWVWLVVGSTRKCLRYPWAWGIPALFLHALVDFPLARAGIAAWAFMLIGALEACDTPPNFQGERRETKNS